MDQNKIDPVVIGKRFSELIEQSYKVERDVKRRHSKRRSELWNHKLEQENECDVNIRRLQEQKQTDIQALTSEYERNKKQLLQEYMNKIDQVEQRKKEVKVKYEEDVKSLHQKFRVEVDEERGRLFENKHLQVAGFSQKDTLRLQEYMRL